MSFRCNISLHTTNESHTQRKRKKMNITRIENDKMHVEIDLTSAENECEEIDVLIDELKETYGDEGRTATQLQTVADNFSHDDILEILALQAIDTIEARQEHGDYVDTSETLIRESKYKNIARDIQTRIAAKTGN